jgi:hypothetical protein
MEPALCRSAEHPFGRLKMDGPDADSESTTGGIG